MLPVEQPVKTYTGLDGKPLDGGYIYFGLPNQNPITAPVTVYWDSAGTQPAAQPLRTVNGYIVRNGTPANVFFSGSYSELVQDSAGRQVFFARTSDDFSIASFINNFIINLASSVGSSLIGFIQSAIGSVTRTVQDKLRDEVSVFDFMTSAQIADVQARTYALDLTAPIQAARDHIALNRKKLIFPPGGYKYSVSPNWAIHHAEIVFEGDVTLRYTGTGDAVIFDASASDAVVFITGFCYGVKFGWGKRPNIEAPATAGNGIYVRSMHHCKIGGRVRGCGSASSGLRVEFAVCTEFDVVVSGNEDGWYLNAKPANGYYLTRRNSGETTSYCTFLNPVAEGPTIGIYRHATLGNNFFGGTAEACSLYGTFGDLSAEQDKFVGTDFEANATADVFEQGTGLILENCDTFSNLTLGAACKNATVYGGRHSKILSDTGSLRSTIRDVVFNRFNDGTNLTDAGTGTLLDNCRNGGTNTTYLSGTLAFAGATIANNALAIFSITVTGAKLGDFAQIAYDAGGLGNMIIWGQVTAANLVTAFAFNNTGAGVTVPAGNWRAVVSRR